jgi:hypothetical protein
MRVAFGKYTNYRQQRQSSSLPIHDQAREDGRLRPQVLKSQSMSSLPVKNKVGFVASNGSRPSQRNETIAASTSTAVGVDKYLEWLDQNYNMAHNHVIHLRRAAHPGSASFHTFSGWY